MLTARITKYRPRPDINDGTDSDPEYKHVYTSIFKANEIEYSEYLPCWQKAPRVVKKAETF